MIKNFSEKDIDVTLVFVVSDTSNEAMNRILIHRDANLSATYCAANTADRQGLVYLRAITEFFAGRYAENNMVTRFVFGECVANNTRYYNMGEKTLSRFTEEYSRGFRTVFNAVRSYSPYVKVYTFIDGVWNRGLAFDNSVRFDNKAFLDAFTELQTKTWSDRFGMYSGQEVVFSGTRNAQGKNQLYVDSSIPGNPPIEIIWRVRPKNDGYVD